MPRHSCLRLLSAPGQIIRLCGSHILIHQVLHDLPGVVHLVQVVCKHVLLPELLDVGVATPHLVVVPESALEEGHDGGVVGQHQTGNAMS